MRASAWLAGALFVLALAGWPAAGGDQDERAKQPADLAWGPADGALLVSVRPADLCKGDLGKAFLAELAKEEKSFTAGIEQEVGLAPAEMERLTVVFADLKS